MANICEIHLLLNDKLFSIRIIN